MRWILFFIAFAAWALASDGAHIYKTRCANCHGDDGSKAALGYSASIGGRSAADLEQKLLKYKGKEFGGDMKIVMQGNVARLKEPDIKAVAAYVATLGK